MPYFKALPPVSRRPLSAASSTQVTPRHARRFIQPADSRRAPTAHELMVESNAIIAEVQALVSNNTETQRAEYTDTDSKLSQQRMEQRFNRDPLRGVSSKSEAVDDGLTSFEALIASLLLEYGAIAFSPMSSVEAAYVACLDRSKSRKRTEELPRAVGSTAEEDSAGSKGGSSALSSSGLHKKEMTLIKPLPLAEEGLLSDLSIKAIASAQDAALAISKRKGDLARPSSSPSSLLSGRRGFAPYGADADALTSSSSARLSARERSLRRMYYTPPPTVYMDKGGLSGVRASVRGTTGGVTSTSSSAAAATSAAASSEGGNGISSTSAAVESLITSAFTQMLSSGGRRGFSFDVPRGHRTSSFSETSGGNVGLGEEATAVRRALATASQFPVGSVGYTLAMTAAARIVFTYHSLASSAFPSSPTTTSSSRAVGGAHYRHGSKGKSSFSSVPSPSRAPESPLSSGGGEVGGVHSPTRKTIGPAKGVSFFLTQHASVTEESSTSKSQSKEAVHPPPPQPPPLSLNALATGGIHHHVHVGEPDRNRMVSVPPSASSPLAAAASSTLVESFVKAWRTQACIFLPQENNEDCGKKSQKGVMPAASRRMSTPQGARCLFLDPFSLMQNGTMKSAALFWQQHCPPRNPILLDKHTMQLLRSVPVPTSSAVPRPPPHPPSPRQASTPKAVSISGGLMMPSKQGRARSVLAAYIRRPVAGKEMEIKATKDEVLNLRRVFNEVQLHLPELARLQQQKRINLESEEGQALCLADIFSLIDTDSSGEVDEDEFVAFGHKVGGETAKVFSRCLFRRILTPSDKRPASCRDAGEEADASPSSPSREGHALPNSPLRKSASTPRSTTFASLNSSNGLGGRQQQQQHVYSSSHDSSASHVMRPPSGKSERSGITLRELQTLLFPNYAKAVLAQEEMAEDRRREVTTMPRQWQDTFDARDIEELHRTFCEIDADGNGCISATELAVYCEGPAALTTPKTGGPAPLKRYEEHLKRFDTNGDGFIDFREFAEMQRYYLDTTRGRVRQNGDGGGGVGGASTETPAQYDARHSFNGGGIQPPQWLPYYD